MPLRIPSHAQPGEHGDRKHTSREFLRLVIGEVAEVDLTCSQGEVTRDFFRTVDQHFGDGKVLFLMLQRLGLQPNVDLWLAAEKRFARVGFGQSFQAKTAIQSREEHGKNMSGKK